jgi:hypothetical protein
MERKTLFAYNFFVLFSDFSPSNLPYTFSPITQNIAQPPSTNNNGDGGGWETFCFLSFSLDFHLPSRKRLFFEQWIYNSLKWCLWMLKVLRICKLILFYEYSGGKVYKSRYHRRMLHDLMLKKWWITHDMLFICSH